MEADMASGSLIESCADIEVGVAAASVWSTAEIWVSCVTDGCSAETGAEVAVAVAVAVAVGVAIGGERGFEAKGEMVDDAFIEVVDEVAFVLVRALLGRTVLEVLTGSGVELTRVK